MLMVTFIKSGMKKKLLKTMEDFLTKNGLIKTNNIKIIKQSKTKKLGNEIQKNYKKNLHKK